MAKPRLESAFADFKQREALAEAMIPMIGSLYRKNVVIYIHGVPLYNQSVIDLMKAHRFVRQIENYEMSEFEVKLSEIEGILIKNTASSIALFLTELLPLPVC